MDSRERIGQEIVVLLQRGANFQMLECLCRKQHAAFTSVLYSIWPLKGGLQAVDSRERIDQEIEVLLQRGTHSATRESLCKELQDTFTLCFIEYLASLGGAAGGGLAGAN